MCHNYIIGTEIHTFPAHLIAHSSCFKCKYYNYSQSAAQRNRRMYFCITRYSKGIHTYIHTYIHTAHVYVYCGVGELIVAPPGGTCGVERHLLARPFGACHMSSEFCLLITVESIKTGAPLNEQYRLLLERCANRKTSNRGCNRCIDYQE